MPYRRLTESEAQELLSAEIVGRLATCDSSGQPYITPVNYLYCDGSIYFHCRTTGKKLDNIAANRQVCFEVSRQTKTTVRADAPCTCSTRYSCVLAFGTAHEICEDREKARILNLLMDKLAAGKPFTKVSDRQAASCSVIEVRITELSGKINFDPE